MRAQCQVQVHEKLGTKLNYSTCTCTSVSKHVNIAEELIFLKITQKKQTLMTMSILNN